MKARRVAYRDRLTKASRPYDIRGRDWSDTATNQGCQGLPGATRSEDSFPGAFKGNMEQSTALFQTSRPELWENKFLLFYCGVSHPVCGNSVHQSQGNCEKGSTCSCCLKTREATWKAQEGTQLCQHLEWAWPQILPQNFQKGIQLCQCFGFSCMTSWGENPDALCCEIINRCFKLQNLWWIFMTHTKLIHQEIEEQRNSSAQT